MSNEQTATENNQANQLPEKTVNQIASFPELIKEKYPEWMGRAQRATAALSIFKEITTDEQDKEAEQMLVKVRNTYEIVYNERLTLTRFTDELKTLLMVPENTISATDKDSEYLRVKKLRDGYATAKAKRIAEEKENALRDQRKREEIARLNQLFTDRFYNNIVLTAGKVRESLYGFLKGFTLENFEEKAAQLKLKPQLKKEAFESWFLVETSLVGEDITTYMSKLKEQFTYDKINAEYQAVAQPIVDEYTAKLPGLRAELTELSQKSEADALIQKEKLEQEQLAELKKRQDEDAKLLEEQAKKSATTANNERLEATFQTQLTLQSQETLKGVTTKRIAIIDCPPEKIVQVFVNVLFACFSNKKFPGYLKTDKKGNILPPDEDGLPQYNKWADDLLSFYATYCDTPIEGITFTEKISTTQKAAKAPSTAL